MCIYNFDKEQSNFLKFRKQLWTSAERYLAISKMLIYFVITYDVELLSVV